MRAVVSECAGVVLVFHRASVVCLCLACGLLQISVCMLIVSNALLMSNATIMVRSGGSF